MPQIIVTTDDADARELYRERVVPSHFHSTMFAEQLAERLAWAVDDAKADEPPLDSSR